jgi:chloramphenicol O-acetyltransferase type A
LAVQSTSFFVRLFFGNIVVTGRTPGVLSGMDVSILLFHHFRKETVVMKQLIKKLVKKIDLSTWKRRQQFELFSAYENPYWGVTVNIDYTKMYEKSKREKFPFYLGYHYASLRAANTVDAFRQRIENGKPIEYKTVHLSTTIARPDGTFGFSFTPFSDDFDKFVTDGITESERVMKSDELFSEHSADDVIYYTVLRGVTFMSDNQPYRAGSSVPILVFGEMFFENGIYKIPHSIHVNHALVDGQHVSKYIQLFQQFLND